MLYIRTLDEVFCQLYLNNSLQGKCIQFQSVKTMKTNSIVIFKVIQINLYRLVMLEHQSRNMASYRIYTR